MDLTERAIATATREAIGGYVIPGDVEIDLTPPWRRLTIADALREYGGVEIEGRSADDLRAVAKEKDVEVSESATRGEIVEELVSTLVEPGLIQPTFLIDFPVDFPGSLLAKRKPDNPEVVERFEMYAGGMEIANGFSELNDPKDQLARMQEAAAARGAEPHEVDWDYIRALEQGMPPTGGVGFGIDRVVLLITGAHHIRETILFPLLRPLANDYEES
jgi:lysyl-tRNA synthetase class 2